MQLPSRRRRYWRRQWGIRATYAFVVVVGIVVYIYLLRESLLITSNEDELYASDSNIHRGKREDPVTLLSDDKLRHLPEPFSFLKDILPQTTENRLLGSDVVDLRHCDLTTLDWDDYTAWAALILDNMTQKIQTSKSRFPWQEWNNHAVPEFVLNLLEIFATHQGHCRFDQFPPSLSLTSPSLEQEVASKLHKVPPPTNPDHARLAMVIVAFQDVNHLTRLVEALHLPHHYIIIHLERRTSLEYSQQVYQLASRYSNVVVLQFGTITYPTDSISMINLQIMKWLTMDLGLTYDYHMTMCGAVYPLYNNEMLAIHLKRSNQQVWLGELTGGTGSRIDWPQYDYLQRKRLIYTSGNGTKATFRIHKSLTGSFEAVIPPETQRAMTRKTNSGNQAVYSYDTVRRLLQSSMAMELFGIAKYGCCCCLEERTWIAAMRLIGLGNEALQHGSTWQVWGGYPQCRSSKSNALLSSNGNICYRVEDATDGLERNNETALYIQGSAVLDYLMDAKRRGFLMARKFRSMDPPSMALLEDIQRILHPLPT